MSELPPRLNEIVEDFSYCEGQEKLEYLLELSETLRPLPAWLHGKRSQMDEVHECMTPVFVFAEREEGSGKLHFHFDIPPEAPTVSGFAAILQQGLDSTTPEVVADIPDMFYREMGLQTVLSGQRLNGMTAMLAHIKRLVVR